MPSRQYTSPSPQPPLPPPDHHQLHLVPPLTVAFSFLIALTFCFRKCTTRKRASHSDTKPPHKFSYTALRTATGSFSPSNRLGQGGFGSVYRGTLNDNRIVAVKVMDAGSLQGEREFQNELLFAGKIESDRILSVIGFSSDTRRRRMVLVYELMANGSLQNCLLHRKCLELKEWNRRLSIAIDIAKGIEYLHHYCDPPIIHGDIKPSNILLDHNFNAKIGDFGLARLKPEDECRVDLNSKIEEEKKICNSVVDDNGSMFEETESLATTTVCEEFSIVPDNQSPESFFTAPIADTSPETCTQSPVMASAGDASPSEVNLDVMSVDSGGNGGSLKKNRKIKGDSGKDWWWKQDNGVSESGRVKDYVMEWIGSEIKKERPKTEWIATGASSSASQNGKSEKKNRKRLDWWISLDDDKNKNVKKQKRRPAREWWKEEYCDELAKKKLKNKKKQMKESNNNNINNDNWLPKDDELYVDRRKKKRSRSRGGSKGSVDWWLDGFSGDLFRARYNSHDSVSGGTGISSTPSMRGTVCYVAPEYSCDGNLSEKCDVYSFGVLLLVLVAGRRPLQVTGSPMSEFQRANLLSWAHRLARAGKLLDLVDESVQCLDREQALECIVVALLCLQKSPALRPSMKEVVAMLSGDLEPPPLPVEYSPSHHSRFKSHRKAR